MNDKEYTLEDVIKNTNVGFAILHEEINKRFAAIDEKFDEVYGVMKRGFDGVYTEFEKVYKKIDGLEVGFLRWKTDSFIVLATKTMSLRDDMRLVKTKLGLS